MNLQDVAGVFGRYFVVGFFLPPFFTLFVLAHSLSTEMLPDAYERHGEGAQVLILGGSALLLALLASGARNLVELLFSGVVLIPQPGSPAARYVRPFTKVVMLPATTIHGRFVRERDSDATDAVRRTQLAWHLDRRYPADGDLAPTAYGNAQRAIVSYSWTRWNLDMQAVENRVLPLMSEGERATYDEARTDLAFFVNSTLGAFAVLVVLLVDEIAYRPHSAGFAWVYVLAALVVVLLYRQSVAALERLGMCKRAAVDLHRLEMYEQLGLTAPVTPEDERATAHAVNRCLLWGEPLPTALYKGGRARS